MSGFITIYNTDGEPVDEQLINSLTQTLKFRGPDQQKVWIDDNVGMGHALFKTTFEAEYENQPATIDNKVWITCCARIDDRDNLVNKMGLKQSLDLSKTPDSELILHAYRKWGEDCLEHLLGDFAFVIWDKTKQKLFCAKDRFGMRQLYYVQKNKSIIICNALGCILKHPDVSKNLNEKAIGGFLLFDDYKWMDKSITMFNDITTLLPAHKLVMENGHINIQRYWNIPHNIPLLHYRTEQEYIDHFLEIFSNAVKDRIRYSSVAISMSGGMDSTSIAAITKKLISEQKIPKTKLNAITIVYDSILPSKERYFANLAADYINLPIHYINGDNYPYLLPSIKTTAPITLAQTTLLIDTEKKYRQFSPIVLVGITGDNLLEYPSTPLALKESNIFNVIKAFAKHKKLYNKKVPLGTGLKTKFKKMISNNTNELQTWYPYPTYINKKFENKIYLKREWERMWGSMQYHQSLQARHELYKEIASLEVADWNSDDFLMESTFTLSEKRDPFLDVRMVEFILSLPALPWLFNKHILRASMSGLLPSELLYRPKTPLGYLDHALAIKEENKWLEKWKPNPLSLRYLKDESLFPKNNDENQNYLLARPITLDGWLKNNY